MRLGYKELALAILDNIEQRCLADEQENSLLLHYIKQEKTEKSATAHSPKALNNLAVSYYQQGNTQQALSAFRQAFTVMPKNPAIALNLIQTTASEIRAKRQQNNVATRELLFNCMTTIETARLTEEQHDRYQKLKKAVRTLVDV